MARQAGSERLRQDGLGSAGSTGSGGVRQAAHDRTRSEEGPDRQATQDTSRRAADRIGRLVRRGWRSRQDTERRGEADVAVTEVQITRYQTSCGSQHEKRADAEQREFVLEMVEKFQIRGSPDESELLEMIFSERAAVRRALLEIDERLAPEPALTPEPPAVARARKLLASRGQRAYSAADCAAALDELLTWAEAARERWAAAGVKC